ncbi:MAG: recombinase family protein [Sphingopyxis sp.]|nr:recombinase family protein [Sphingopyxis sp.]
MTALRAIATPTDLPKVYSYTRFSTPEQSQGDSARRQGEAARKWAEARGLPLDESLRLTDLGVSAYRGANMSTDRGLGGFLTACHAGLIAPGSYLLVENLDRISRMTPLLAQQVFASIILSGVTIVSLSDGKEFSQASLEGNPLDLIMAMMNAWRAHDESKLKGRRVAAAWAEKRRKVAAGETNAYTRRAPAWLRWSGEGWQLHPQHAETVRRVYRDTLAGAGEHAIAKALNAERVPVMVRGKMWHRSTVAKLLRNPAVTGALVTGHIDYGEGRRRRVAGDTVPAFYPAVISADDWASVRAIKDGSIIRARGRSASAPVRNMLAGLARCPECGAAMTRVYKGSGDKGGSPKLVCTKAKAGAASHGYVSVPLDKVHDAIASGWQALLADVPAGGRGSDLDREARNLSGEISAAEDALADMIDHIARAPSLALSRHIRAAEASLAVLRGDLDAIEMARASADGGLVHARLAQLADTFGDPEGGPPDVPTVNAALRLVFAGVTVDHQSGLLLFQWRQGGETAVRYAWTDA